MLRNTTFYAYNVRIYYTIDLWTSMTYCYDFWQCKVSVLCALLPNGPPGHPAGDGAGRAESDKGRGSGVPRRGFPK